jgi:CelD/BcsL family acetyltransferase involved in cellulose biosynthesis
MVASPVEARDEGTTGQRSRRASNRPERTILLGELEPRHVAAWRELAREAAEPNPFFEPDCVLPAARHFGPRGAALLVVEDRGGEWLACLPATRLQRGGARLPALSAWRHVHAPLATPLVARSAVESAAERLLDLALRTSRSGVVALPWLGDEGPVSAALLAALEQRGGRVALHRSFERAVMRRPTLDEGVEPLLGRGHRRDLDRLGRRLAEQLAGPLEVRDESARAAAVDGFLAVEASGWKGQQGTALASAGHGAFFRELCDGFRARGRLQLLSLGTAERTVSYKCNLLAGDAVFCFKIAFDAACARYRPGLQLELRMLHVFRDEMEHAWMDSCAAPDSPLFEHLWPERRRIASYAFVDGGALGRLIEGGVSLARRSRGVIRR